MKNTVKNIIGRSFSRIDYPLLVNSYGRSGSTVLTRSIIESTTPIKNGLLRDIATRSISREAWELDDSNLEAGIVYKTHDYPPPSYSNKDVRMLYTFGDPVDVVISLLRLMDEKGKGEEWMKSHFEHLSADYRDNFKDIIHEDTLGLENHLESWLEEKRIPIAFIRYENMWQHQGEISQFLGIQFKLPPYKERKASKRNEDELIAILACTYEPLKKIIKELDDYFVINA